MNLKVVKEDVLREGFNKIVQYYHPGCADCCCLLIFEGENCLLLEHASEINQKLRPLNLELRKVFIKM